jgi:hypothetical protein
MTAKNGVSDMLDMDSAFGRKWAGMDTADEKLPRFLQQIHEIEYDEFRAKVDSEDSEFVNSAVQALYAGDAFIIRGAFPAQFMRDLQGRTHEWCQRRPESFHKMLEGTPDFHRRITEELASNYSIRHVKHSAYFYPWNDDPMGILDHIRERWRLIKNLSGHHRDEFEKNTPKDGVVDRVQVVRYPSGAGHIESHTDPYRYQRLIISCYMSKRGVDFASGGFYVLGVDEREMDMESAIEVGDICIHYASILHGVKIVDEDEDLDWDSTQGRWFLSLYSNVSDHVKDRHTSRSIEKVG